MRVALEGIPLDLGVSKNRDTPKSSILIGFALINHPFWGTPIFGNTYSHDHWDPLFVWQSKAHGCLFVD